MPFSPEIKSIEWLSPDRISGEETHFAGVYAFLAWNWTLLRLADESELRIYPGDVLLLLSRSDFQLKPVRPEGANESSGSVLRIQFDPQEIGETSGSAAPSPFCHLRSCFSPDSIRPGSGAPAETVASLLCSIILATQLEVTLSHRGGNVEPDVALAIQAMQREPSRAWTIELLAREAGVSRSTLAQKFKAQTNQTPNDFLLNLRMRLAEELMRGRKHHLKEIARRTGYQSVSAFSTAFKRWSGAPPSVHRRRSGM